jgi:hypothetical protein
MLVSAIMDLHAPLDLTADPAKLTEDLERTRRTLLKEAIGIEDTRRRILSTSTTPPKATRRPDTA